VDLAQVTQHRDEQGAQQPDEDGPAADAAHVEGTADAAPLRPGAVEVIGDAKGAHGRHGEPGRDDQVVGHGGRDADELDQRPDHDLAKVVIVEIAPGEPRVVGRKLGALDDGVQVGQVHGLFAALPGMPQVGVAPADDPEEAKERQEEDLADQHEAPLPPARGEQLGHPPPRAGQQHAAVRHGGHDGQRQPDGATAVVQRRQVGQHPRQPGQEQHAHRPGQDPAPVGQPAKDGQGQGQGRQAHRRQQQQPGQGRPAAGQAVAVKDRRPGAALLLDLALLGGEHQRVLALARPLLLRLLPAPFRHVPRIQPMGDRLPVDAFAEEGADLLPVVTGRLAKDVHPRVIVDGELLLGPGVVELDAEQARVGVELGGQLEAELFRKEQLVVAGGHGVAHGQARDGLPQPPAAHHDIVRLVQGVQQHLQLLAGILVVERQLVDAVRAAGIGDVQAAIQARAKGRVAKHVKGQRVVKVLVGNDRAIADQGRALQGTALKVVGLPAFQGYVGNVQDVLLPAF